MSSINQKKVENESEVQIVQNYQSKKSDKMDICQRTQPISDVGPPPFKTRTVE